MHTPTPSLSQSSFYPLEDGLGVAQAIYLFFFFAVLGFELRAYTLSHSISPFFVMGFF
jgi:hypothetical protein